MAMVTITNGEITTKVPMSAYQSQFKRTGFTIVSDKAKSAVEEKVEKKAEKKEQKVEEKEPVEEQAEEVEVDDVDEVDEDAAFVEEILEKPLSQWSTDELKEFVRIKGIDTKGAKKTSEVRSIVKGFLEEQDRESVS